MRQRDRDAKAVKEFLEIVHRPLRQKPNAAASAPCGKLTWNMRSNTTSSASAVAAAMPSARGTDCWLGIASTAKIYRAEATYIPANGIAATKIAAGTNRPARRRNSIDVIAMGTFASDVTGIKPRTRL